MVNGGGRRQGWGRQLELAVKISRSIRYNQNQLSRGLLKRGFTVKAGFHGIYIIYLAWTVTLSSTIVRC